MTDDMDLHPSNLPRASLAESSATSIDNAAFPRLRATSKLSSTHAASTHSPPTQQQQQQQPSPQPSPQSSPTSSGPQNKSEEKQAAMGPTEEAIASSVYHHADYFGPIVYSAGETILPPILLMLSAIFFFFADKVTMVVSSLLTIVFIQQYKLLKYQYLSYKQRREQDDDGPGYGAPFFLPVFLKAMHLFNLFLCAAIFFVLLACGAAAISPNLAYCLMVPPFVLSQCIYWPVHGYNLHRNITQYRPIDRADIRRSIQQATRRRWFYSHGDFFLIFAGSGGHTTEILSLMRLFEPFDKSFYRRYIITSGDERSSDMIKQFEEERAQRMGMVRQMPGVYEIVFVARARYVGQSWLTTPFTALWCIFDCYRILNMGRPHAMPGATVEYPQTIVCNGPGSSSMFVLVSHLMRMYGLMPANRGMTVFVESIARVCSLSLTGKIFYHLDLADAFVVQHRGVEDVYPGVFCEPMLVKRLYPPGVLPFGWR
ncbi:hypothetical protein PFICI_08816 [Pestalotiopsis fici W106-1]|uniref:UDP-N-acetylglucosamine transferase subunit ALG14 n=1 Tax=Pestalotiopsis fici (strain W106-1 / CGMCC3.15140) TaxID=1229662 RepID=W3WYL2_PESFW|nr:uncharacterized protein PFICI_08816 [Pestalotiopsis fici W106-1]ETS78963.1 hypothetical protein PFICI_08816 [Pestalotiopsis fici W106-1]